MNTLYPYVMVTRPVLIEEEFQVKCPKCDHLTHSRNSDSAQFQMIRHVNETHDSSPYKDAMLTIHGIGNYVHTAYLESEEEHRLFNSQYNAGHPYTPEEAVIFKWRGPGRYAAWEINVEGDMGDDRPYGAPNHTGFVPVEMYVDFVMESLKKALLVDVNAVK